MDNFYKGGRGLAFSQREEGASSRKEKPPRLTKILTNQVREGGATLPSATVREVFDVSSEYPRDLFDTGSGAVREVFDCCSGGSRRTTEAHPKQYRSCPEPVPKRTRSAPEGHPNSTRRNRWVFHRFFDVFKAGIKYRCSKDVVPFTQRLRKMAEVPLMYRECTVSVRGVYRKGTGDLLRSYWRSTTDLLKACTSGVDQRYSNRRGIVGEAMKNKVTLCLTGLLCFMLFNLSDAWAQSAIPRTAEGQIEIKPLDVGDTVPEEVWDMPLQTVRYGGETKEMRLADYRGKVIILDYWATWCLGCILSMPKMHELVEDLDDQVVLFPVTNEDRPLITKYLSTTRSKTIQSFGENFNTIVGGSVLSDLIPHQTIPHIAIISPDGILEQTTKPHLLNEEALLSMVVGKEYYLPAYRGKMDTTVLSNTFTDLKAYRPTYYTTMGGYMDGFDVSNWEYTDSVSAIKKGNYINYAILKLLQIAAPRKRFDAMRPNRRIMVTADSSKLDFYYDREIPFDRERFSISYEYALPVEWSADQIKDKILEDMALFTGYYAGYIEREMPCLVIRKQPGAQISESKSTLKLVENGEFRSNPPKYVGNSPSGANTYFKGAKVDNIVLYLNNQYNEVFPCVIDSTGINYRIDVDLPERLGDIELLKETLQQQGFDVQIENHIMEMFVVADRPIHELDIETPELVLTRYGYVLKKERGRQ